MIADSLSICPASSVVPSHKILLRNSGTELIIVLDEFVDEFMQAALKDFLDAAVLQFRAHHARLALGVALTAIRAGDSIEILHQILVTTRQ